MEVAPQLTSEEESETYWPKSKAIGMEQSQCYMQVHEGRKFEKSKATCTLQSSKEAAMKKC